MEKTKLRPILGIWLLLCLVSCSSGYQKEDGKWVWISYDEAIGERVKQIDECDVESFKVLSNGNYATDKHSVYFIGKKINGADPASFQVINNTGYSKDDKNVFLDDELLIFANPKSFELLEFPYSKDDYHIFCGTIPLEIEKREVPEFKVTNTDESTSRIKSSILLSHFIERNPTYGWLDTLGVNGVIVGKWATGETNKRSFKGFKELKD